MADHGHCIGRSDDHHSGSHACMNISIFLSFTPAFQECLQWLSNPESLIF